MRKHEWWFVTIRPGYFALSVQAQSPRLAVDAYIRLTRYTHRIKITKWGRRQVGGMYVDGQGIPGGRNAWYKASLLNTDHAWEALKICGANASEHQFQRALKHVLKETLKESENGTNNK